MDSLTNSVLMSQCSHVSLLSRYFEDRGCNSEAAYLPESSFVRDSVNSETEVSNAPILQRMKSLVKFRRLIS